MSRIYAATILMTLLSTGRAAAECTAIRDIEAAEARVTVAYEANDLKTYFAFYAPDLRALFPEGPTSYPEYVKSWTKFVHDGGRVDHFGILNMVVQAGASCDVAVASYQAIVHTKNPGAAPSIDHFDETDVWFKRHAVWKIVEIHYSRSGPS